MSRGKYLSLPEARKKRQLDRFAAEHEAKGNAKELERVIAEMSKTPELTDQKAPKERDRED